MIAAVLLGAAAVFEALHDDVPLRRGDAHALPVLAEADVLCLAASHARPREGIAERGHPAPACLPAGYGVPEGDLLVLHLRPDGTCDAVRLDGAKFDLDAAFDLRCLARGEAGGAALRRDGAGLWRWAPG